MICYREFRRYCTVWFLLLLSTSCSQLPDCRPSRGIVQVPSVSACKSFVKLLEDPQYCNLDQAQDCCVVLDATVSSQCHCWQGFSSATIGLITLLQKHCAEQYPKDVLPSLNIKVFIGVLTSSAHAEQRHAGTYFVSLKLQAWHFCHAPDQRNLTSTLIVLQSAVPGPLKHKVIASHSSLQFRKMRPSLTS